MAYNRLNVSQKAIFDRSSPKFSTPSELSTALLSAVGPTIRPEFHTVLWSLYRALTPQHNATIVQSGQSSDPLSNWSPTPPPPAPLSTFRFRPTHGAFTPSSQRSASPSKRSRASSQSPDPPGPDEIALSSTNTTAERSTPEASLIAQVASLVELIQALGKDLTATQAQVLSLTNTLRSRGPAPAPTKPAPPPPPPPAPKATKPSFAAVAASGPAAPSNQWQIATKKAKKVRPEPLFKPDYTKVNRELIIELSSPIPSGVSDYAIITAANKALASTE
ncbi:hypothetical protein Q9L58_010597, partial [Maublancomyces gigas]